MRSALGFSLIEILVGLGIIAVLSSVGFVSYSKVSEGSRDNLRKSDLGQLAQALEIYYQKNNKYIGGSGDCSDTTNFYNQIASYLTTGTVPKDPKTKLEYCYVSINNGASFRLFTKLENCSDSDIIKGINCATSPYNFNVPSEDLEITPAAVIPSPPSTPTPTSTPSSTSIPTSTSTPTPVSSDTTYNLGVLVIKYFPLTSDGQNINISVTGEIGDPYTVIRQRTIDITSNLKLAIEKATKYLGYKNPAAQSALVYQIIDTKEYTQAVPMLTDGTRRPNYNLIMTNHNICDYVDNKGVREVWIWAYQGPTYPGSSYPYLNISESKMAGPFGDISNSPRYNDIPVCQKTYRVYTYNYGRYTAEALESWGHQIEAEISVIDNNLFRSIWQGPNYPQTLGVNGRCGSVHNPPNARSEYDRNNPNPQNSDCLDWNPDSLGSLTQISCQNWGCSDIDPLSNNASLNYMIWNWQNLPGKGNTKTYQSKLLRNWWDVHGNFDVVMGSEKTLF